MSAVATSDEDNSTKILDDFSLVRGVIYCVKHTESGKKYVGQTRSHRLNHGRYRPFGAECRFKHHISEAICNTKHKTGHLLGIDIRAYGKEAFTVEVLEMCDKEKADEREIHWISTLNTVHPVGYNLASGGDNKTRPAGMAPIANPNPLSAPGKHGGSTRRSVETRAKMSHSGKISFGTPEARATRSAHATAQHAAAKAARFSGVTIDPTKLDDYIVFHKDVVIVRVGDKEARFSSKAETPEVRLARAKEFLNSLLPTSLSPSEE